MPVQSQPAQRRATSSARCMLALAALLPALTAVAQTQQNPPAAPVQHPQAAPAVVHPQPLPANPAQARPPVNPIAAAAAAAAQRRAALNAASAAGNTRNAAAPTANAHNTPSDLHVASLENGRATANLVQSRTFLGYPGPPGSKETRTANGNIVRTAADGSVIDVRNPRNGMTIHHGLDGGRRILVEQPDHSRVFATTRGLPYVQHPFVFRGRVLNHRTYPVGGQLVHLFYRPYNFGGTALDVYAPTRYYQPQFYQQASSPFAAPMPFRWPYANGATPWYGYYKGYFTPDTSYTTPTAWLADFVLGASLAVAYTTEKPTAPPPAAGAGPAVTPEVKQMVADEVGHQLKEESVEAQQSAANRDPPPGAGGVVQELSDGQSHVFVVGLDLDLVDPTGRRCMISEGDVVQVVSAPRADTGTAGAVVLASKGGEECQRAAQVQIAVADLQEMQNHMRETIDLGMASTDAGKKAATATPAFAAAAPPPDPNTAHEIEQQQQIAAAADS